MLPRAGSKAEFNVGDSLILRSYRDNFLGRPFAGGNQK